MCHTCMNMLVVVYPQHEFADAKLDYVNLYGLHRHTCMNRRIVVFVGA